MNSIYKLGRGLTFQLKLYNVSPCFMFQQNRSAALYGPTNLGVDKYDKARESFSERMNQMIDSFRSKMIDFTKEGSDNMIFTEDLKSMVHLCTKSDIQILEKMMKKFNSQNKELRFGHYVFGPVIMRMYYFLDLPDEAYKAFKDPELSGFFDQLTSYLILMDLLYKHEKYTEVLDVFDYVRNKQNQMLKFPRHILALAMGSLYKQNTEQSLKQATKLWSDMINVGHMPMRRVVTFLAGLALNQGAPHIANEVLATVHNQNYFTVRDMKVYALSELNRPEDAFHIIRSAIEYEGPRETPSSFTQESIERLQAAVERSGNNDKKREFSQLLKALLDRNAIDKQNTIVAHLSKEIVITQPLVRHNMDDPQLQQSFRHQNPTGNRQQFNKYNNSRNTPPHRHSLSDRY